MFSLKSFFKITIVVTIYTISLASSAPVQTKPQAENYLSINSAVLKVLNDKTREQMSIPRCGVNNKVTFDSNSRSKRYALLSSIKSKTKKITYKISKYSIQLSKQRIDDGIARAFDTWSEYVDFTFIRKYKGKVDIEISFEKYDHDDDSPFDGPMGVFAHAGVSKYKNVIHFDDSEDWTIDENESWDSDETLFQVAVHEIGHILGLDHSNKPSSIMYAYLRLRRNFRLDIDDIQGIQALYGSSRRQQYI